MRAISYLIGGNIFAQAVGLAIIPIVARLFGPEIVGAAGMFAALSAVFTQISAFSYPLAIVLPKDDEEAAAITSLSVLISIATSSLVALILSTSLSSLVSLLGLEAVRQFFWLIPLLMLMAVLYSILDQWANRLGFFGAKALSTAISASLVSAAKLTVGFVSPSAFGLIATTSATPTVQLLSLLSWRRVRFGIKVAPLTKYLVIFDSAKKYRDFALFRAPEQFLNAITQGLPVLLFGIFYGPAYTGYLALAIAALNTPANMVGKAVLDVVYPRLSREVDDGGSLRPTLIRNTVSLMLVAGPSALILAIYAPSIFSLVFGEDWLTSGQYARWLALWTFMMVSNRAAMAAIPVISAQRSLLLYTLFSTPIRASAMYLAHITFNDPLVTVIAFSISSAGLNLFLVFSTIFFQAPQHRG